MEVLRVEDAKYARAVETRNLGRRCIFYNGEICSAPGLRFEISKACCRINLRFAVASLFQKIVVMAQAFMGNPVTPPAPALPAK